MSDQQQLWEIIGRYIDGAASANEVQKIEAELLQDPQLRSEFLRYIHLDAALESSCRATSMVTPIQTGNRSRRLKAILVAASLLIMAAAFAWFRFGPEMLSSAPKKSIAPIAVLAAENNAIWSDPNTELALRGGELPEGSLKLESGTAEFLFIDGATVLLRGPAQFLFLDRKRLFVEQGRVFCRCPSAESRLSIQTPTAEVIDLGTEFSVEARADRSTIVAVLSGEVQIGKRPLRYVRKGEAVEIRSDGLRVIQPLDPDEFAELILAAPAVHDAMKHGTNLLRDPGFEKILRDDIWSGTEPNIRLVADAGRSGAAARIAANGVAHWPLFRQKVEQPMIAGRLVVATVWAAPDKHHLRPHQTAMLKIVFVNDEGREFAFARRCILDSRSAPNVFQPLQVAAFAPAGTKGIRLQLLFKTNLLDSGAVLFDDASLTLVDP